MLSVNPTYIATTKKRYNSGGRHDLGAYTISIIFAAYVSD